MGDDIALRVPRELRLGSRLLWVTAGLSVLLAAVAVIAWVHLAGVRDLYRQDLVDAGRGFDDGLISRLTWNLGYSTTVGLVLAFVAALLARRILLPSRAAQTAGWLAPVLAWLVVGCGVVGDPDASVDRSSTLRQDLVPDWYTSVNTLLALAVLACLTAQAILLFRPAAREFYDFGGS